MIKNNTYHLICYNSKNDCWRSNYFPDNKDYKKNKQ